MSLSSRAEQDDCISILREDLGHAARDVGPPSWSLDDVDCLILVGEDPDHIAKRDVLRPLVLRQGEGGGLVLGIGGGFGFLCSIGLLPGELQRNRPSGFRCRMVSLRVENVANPVTNLAVVGDTWRLPIRGWSARYVASDAVLDQLERDGLVLLRYAPADGARNGSNANHDPTASSRQIAAITNSTRTVVGLTPHPQHAARASLLEARWPGSPAGKTLFESITRWVDERQHGTAGESQR